MPDLSTESHPLDEAGTAGRPVSMPRLSKFPILNYFSVRHTSCYPQLIQNSTYNISCNNQKGAKGTIDYQSLRVCIMHMLLKPAHFPFATVVYPNEEKGQHTGNCSLLVGLTN